MSEELEITLLRSAAEAGKLHWRRHALERMLERGISREEMRLAILYGEAIEVYAQDKPYPSCLILRIDGEALHVVVAFEPGSGICHVITAYRPDTDRFDLDLKTRR